MDRSNRYTSMLICKLSVILMLAVLASSCTANLSSSPEGITEESTASSSDQIASNEIVTEQIDTGVVSSTPAKSETLLGKTKKNLGIAYERSGTQDKIIIETAANNTAYKVLRLENPSRIVLDINEATKASSANLKPEGSSAIAGIRLGSHDQKSRVVLDLKDQGIPEKIEQQGRKIIVSLGSTAPANQVAIQQRKTEIHTLPEAAPIEQVALNSKAPKTQVTGISIEPIPGQGNSLIADVPGIKDFDFIQTAPSEYILTIKEAGLNPVLAQTLLAPPATGLIRSVRPVEKDGDVMLRVFAQPEAVLEAASTEDRVMIREVAGLSAQAKAQPVPESVPHVEKDTTVAAAKEEKKIVEKTEVKTSDEKVAQPLTNDDLSSLLGNDQKYSGRLISLDLQDTDIDNALRIIAEVSNLNIIASSEVAGKVTLRLIDVPWDQALDVILKTNGLDKVQEGNVVRIAPVDKLRLEREALKQAQLAEDELEPLSVKYVRISYARAADLQPLIKSILTERGSVSVDERSNQVIVKDIKRGLKNAVDLIAKLDLRTPQVLLETQIVEANRSILRDLGAQMGFSFIQSPETGNATGYNFPNSVSFGGGIPGSSSASSFPAGISGTEGSAVAAIFGSADGTKSLDLNISALEKEGRVRIVSRPSVATTNNKVAEITSNETISVKKPSTGSTTVVGGTSAANNDATEKIKAGISLKVTPQASPDYYVLMDIEATSSTFGSRVVEGIPSIVERKATSTVLVSSGQTFAIGGIYRVIDKDDVSGVPFLKDVPVLGTFFRRTKVDNSDEELLFFITPRIIEGSFDDAAMTSSITTTS